MGVYGFRDGKFVIKRLTVKDKMPVTYNIPFAIAVSTTYILEGWDVSAGVAKTNTGFSLQPPYAAEVSVNAKVAGATSAAGVLADSVSIIGYTAKGDRVVESVSVSSTADTITYSNNAFANITSITPSASSTSTDVNIGFRNIVGLPYPIDAASDILTAKLGYEYATTALTVDAVYDNIDLNSGLAAGSTAQLVWMSKVQ